MPRIGLLSDSHGRADTTRRGVDLLLAKQVDLLVHLGDIGTPQVIDALLKPSTRGDGILPVRIVFGNTDWDAAALGRYARSVGVRVDHPVGRIDLGAEGETPPGGRENPAGSGTPHPGTRLVFLHGDDASAMRLALGSGATYLCHGHTHEACDRRQDRTRIINPGALFRARVHSVALLDTDRDQVEFLTLGGPGGS